VLWGSKLAFSHCNSRSMCSTRQYLTYIPTASAGNTFIMIPTASAGDVALIPATAAGHHDTAKLVSHIISRICRGPSFPTACRSDGIPLRHGRRDVFYILSNRKSSAAGGLKFTVSMKLLLTLFGSPASFTTRYSDCVITPSSTPSRMISCVSGLEVAL
jgi:hypothetical protein